METGKKQSKRNGVSASIAAMMGVAVGLLAGISLSRSDVKAEATWNATPAAVAAPSSPVGVEAVAANDVSDIQLD